MPLSEEKKAYYRKKSHEYRQRHPERVAAYQARYRKENPFASHFWAMDNPERYLLNISRNSAKRRGIEHTITLADISIPTHCPVLGMKLEMFGAHFNSPSIDRIDNDKGYVPGNVIVVSHRANELKRDATIEELRKLADFYCGGAS